MDMYELGYVLLALLPIIVSTAIMPGQNLINILLLKNPDQGILKASAYVGGLTLMRLLQGFVFGLFLSGESTADQGGKSPIASILLLVLGILFLIAAYRKWSKEDDPDDPPPKWLAIIDSLTPWQAFGIGFGLLLVGAKFWVFTLSAIAIIEEAQIGQTSSTVAYLVFVLLAESLMLLLILTRIIFPDRSASLLESVSAWLTRYNRPMVILVSLVFGLIFFYQGASRLLS